MLFAADTPAAPAVAPPQSFSDRARGYASKAERIIDAPVYDAAGVLGVDVIWLGGVVLALKIISMGVYWEFFKQPPGACCPVCPTPPV